MKKLSKTNFQKVVNYIKRNGRELDQRLFSFYFEKGSKDNVIKTLEKYQNSDGGFGHGIEPDFRSSSSSPIATTMAIEYLEKIRVLKDSPVIIKAMDYLVRNFDQPLQKWRAVPKDVNNFPHAPWWHINDKTGLCVIDQGWENPTVEIIGYLRQYPNVFPSIILEKLTQKAIKLLLSYTNKMESEHILYCYLIFYNHIPEKYQIQIKSKLCELIKGTVNTNVNDWIDKYVPMPLQLVDDPKSPFFSLISNSLDHNLNFLINMVEKKEAWFPTWRWGQYEEDWEKAKIEWTGKNAVNNLIILKKFGRIEN